MTQSVKIAVTAWRGNRTEAARRLGTTRLTLRAKIRRDGLG